MQPEVRDRQEQAKSGTGHLSTSLWLDRCVQVLKIYKPTELTEMDKRIVDGLERMLPSTQTLKKAHLLWHQLVRGPQMDAYDRDIILLDGYPT